MCKHNGGRQAGTWPLTHGNTEQPTRSSRRQFSRCFSPASHAKGTAMMAAQASIGSVFTGYQNGCAMNNTTFTASTTAMRTSASSHDPATAAAFLSFSMRRL